MQPFREDWTSLFRLREEGKIKPVIHKRLPILEAHQAHMLLESGQVAGNIVLLAQELLWPNKMAADLGIFLTSAEYRFESESTLPPQGQQHTPLAAKDC